MDKCELEDHLKSFIFAIDNNPDEKAKERTRDMYKFLLKRPLSANENLKLIATESIAKIVRRSNPNRTLDHLSHNVTLTYKGKTVQIEGTLIVGRHPYLSDFVIPSDGKTCVSRLHGVIVPHNDGVHIVDTGSLNGSVVVFKDDQKKRLVRIGPNKQSVFIKHGQVAHVVLPNEEKP